MESNSNIDLRWRRGAPWLVLASPEIEWRGHRLRHRVGGYTDGMSTPHFAQAISQLLTKLPSLDPYGWAFEDAFFHDAAYHDDLEALVRTSDDDWIPLTLDKFQCDLLLLELLTRRAGEDKELQIAAQVIYDAVKDFGQTSFDEARAKKKELLTT